jgi:hypothetical protein
MIGTGIHEWDLPPRCAIQDGTYDIKWLMFESGKPNKKKAANPSGFCAAHRSMAFIAKGGAVPFLFHSIAVKNGRCSMEDGCLDLRCPLNQTSFRTAKRHSFFGDLLKTEKGWRKKVALQKSLQHDFETRDKLLLDEIFKADGHIVVAEVLAGTCPDCGLDMRTCKCDQNEKTIKSG